MTRRRPAAIAALLAFACLSAAAAALEPSRLTSPTAAALVSDVQALAAPDMEGRRSGTPGGDRAAQRIAAWLAAAGIQPAGDAGTFFQSLAVGSGTDVARATRFELQGANLREAELDREWRPHGGSLSGDVTGEVVFVGHGRDDDYRGIDAAGKIAVALDGAASGPGASTSTRLEKLITARRRGAKALLLVADTLPPLTTTGARVDIVSASITPALADALVGAGIRSSGARPIATPVAARGAPANGMARVHIRVALARRERRAANVIGVLPGRDPTRAREAIVIGAHYDHLGQAGGQTYPGADDNASGTSVVVELARSFAASGGTARTLVFSLFGGEELGLLGSRQYVREPAVPLDRTVAMINVDMVGRLGHRTLMVGGVDSGHGLRQTVGDAASTAGVPVDLRGEPFAPSDQLHFYRDGVPVLFFHTGAHDDYHRPTDTADKIDADGLAKIAALVGHLVERLADGPRPAYTTVTAPRPEPPGAAGAAGTFFGVLADPVEGDGVPIAGVVPDSAASRAGIREGDVLVRFAGIPLVSFEDLRRVVRTHRPGDRVEVLFLRDGEDRTVTVTLNVRP